MLVNRVGDLGIVLGMLVILREYGSLEIFSGIWVFNGNGRKGGYNAGVFYYYFGG